MDFSLLTPDELDVECVVRGIKPSSEKVLEQLAQVYESEVLDPSQVPVKSHDAKNPRSEVAFLASRLEELKLNLLALPITDSDSRAEYRAQALHLLGRARRISLSPTVKNKALQFVSEMERVLQIIEAPKLPEVEGAVGGTFEPKGNPLSPPVDPTLSIGSKFSGAIPKLRLSGSYPPPNNTSVSSQLTNPVAELRSADLLGFGEIKDSPSYNFSMPVSALNSRSQGSTIGNDSQKANAYYNVHSSPTPVPTNPPLVLPRPPVVASLYVPPLNNPVVENRQFPAVVEDRRRSPNRSSVFKWRIVFDGTSGLDVSDFLFRVERLADFERVTSNDLCAGFHSLVSGKAATWYWLYLRVNPLPTWEELRAALLREFQNQESDYEIRKLVESRKQGPRESFSDFRLSVHTLVCKMINPIPEAELIQILRRNMKPSLQEALLLYPVTNILDLRELCNKFEKLWSDIGYPREQVPRRSVYELYSDDPNNGEGDNNSFIPQGALEALHSRPQPQLLQRNPQVQTLQSRILLCWNCSREGHTYQNCSSPPLKLFCYGCGAEGVIKPKCTVCSPENRMRSQPFSGTPRILTPSQVPRRCTEETASNTEPNRNR